MYPDWICHSLVELIVLNVGLSAHILSQRVFSMFVLEALLLTFMTTPAVTYLYPPHLRVRASATGASFANVQAGDEAGRPQRTSSQDSDGDKRTRFTVVLDKLEHLPGMMALTQLIIPPPPPYSVKELKEKADKSSKNSSPSPDPPVSIDAIRLIELSDRTSAVMKSSNVDHLVATDPILDIFGTFGALHGVSVRSQLSIVPFHDLGPSVSEHASRTNSNLVLIPWLPPHSTPSTNPAPTAAHDQTTAAAGVGAEHVPATTPRAAITTNPFEVIFRSTSAGTEDREVSISHSQFVRSVFSSSKTDVALFVDRHQPGGLPKFALSRSQQGGARTHRLFVPFFGGPDDRLALEFAVQLCANPRICATVIKVTKSDADILVRTGSVEKEHEDQPLGEAHAHQNNTTIASVSPILWGRSSGGMAI